MPASINEGFEILSREPVDGRLAHNGRPWTNTDIVAIAGNNNAHLAYEGLISVDTSDDTIWQLTNIASVASQPGWTQIQSGTTVTVDDSISDGQTNPVEGNAIFDALALKLDRPSANPSGNSVVQISSTGAVSYVAVSSLGSGGGGSGTAENIGVVNLTEQRSGHQTIRFRNFRGTAFPSTGNANFSFDIDVVDDSDDATDDDLYNKILVAFGVTGATLGDPVPSFINRQFTTTALRHMTFSHAFVPTIIIPIGSTVRVSRAPSASMATVTVTRGSTGPFVNPSGHIFTLSNSSGGTVIIDDVFVDSISGHIQVVPSDTVNVEISTSANTVTWNVVDDSIGIDELEDDILPRGVALDNTDRNVPVGAIAIADSFKSYVNISSSVQTGVRSTSSFTDTSVWRPINSIRNLDDLDNVDAPSTSATQGQTLVSSGDGEFFLRPFPRSNPSVGVNGEEEFVLSGQPTLTVGSSLHANRPNADLFIPLQVTRESAAQAPTSGIAATSPFFVAEVVSRNSFTVNLTATAATPLVFPEVRAAFFRGTNVIQLRTHDGHVIYQGILFTLNQDPPSAGLIVLDRDVFRSDNPVTFNEHPITGFDTTTETYTRDTSAPLIGGTIAGLEVFIRRAIHPDRIHTTYRRTGQPDITHDFSLQLSQFGTIRTPLNDIAHDIVENLSGTGFTGFVARENAVRLETIEFANHPADFANIEARRPFHEFPALTTNAGNLAFTATTISRGTGSLDITSTDNSVSVTETSRTETINGISVQTRTGWNLSVGQGAQGPPGPPGSTVPLTQAIFQNVDFTIVHDDEVVAYQFGTPVNFEDALFRDSGLTGTNGFSVVGQLVTRGNGERGFDIQITVDPNVSNPGDILSYPTYSQLLNGEVVFRNYVGGGITQPSVFVAGSGDILTTQVQGRIYTIRKRLDAVWTPTVANQFREADGTAVTPTANGVLTIPSGSTADRSIANRRQQLVFGDTMETNPDTGVVNVSEEVQTNGWAFHILGSGTLGTTTTRTVGGVTNVVVAPYTEVVGAGGNSVWYEYRGVRLVTAGNGFISRPGGSVLSTHATNPFDDTAITIPAF